METLSSVPEASSLPLRSLLAFGVGLVILSYLITRLFANRHGKVPPQLRCLPVIGGLLKFIKGPLNLMKEGYEKHGEIFTVSVFHKKITFLLGPSVSHHFYKASDDEVSQKEVYDFNVPTFGPGVVYDVDNKVRAEQFKFLAEALKGKKLLSYIPSFVKEATDFVKDWGVEGEVDLKDKLSILTTMTASRTLLGREVRESLFEEAATLLHDLDEGMIPLSVLNPYLPIPAHFKRDRARKQLHDIFINVQRQRRASGRTEDDLMQVFMDSKYKTVYDGRAVNEEEVAGLLIAGLFAGQHTSSITSSWTGYYLIGNRDWYDAVIKEQQEVMKEFGDELSYEALCKMEVLHRVITEVLRLHPPLIMLLRYVRESFSLSTKTGDTYVVPKGHIVVTSPWFQHRRSDLFADPDNFDPDRFAPPREEHNKAPFSFIGFGGGRHSCMGYNFAYLQIKAIWSVMLRNFDFELVDPIPQPNLEAMVVGPKDGRVRYTARKLQPAK